MMIENKNELAWPQSMPESLWGMVRQGEPAQQHTGVGEEQMQRPSAATSQFDQFVPRIFQDFDLELQATNPLVNYSRQVPISQQKHI